MRIAFLYNAQDHHLLHSLPIACELLRVSPEHEVVVFARNAEQLRLARRLAAFYPGHHRLVFEVLRPSRLPGRLKRRKRAVLLANRARLATFDALVLPERNSVFLRRLWVTRPKLIHTFHGPSGHDRVDDPRLKRFDTGVYLHQVVARNGRLDRFVDLPQAFTAFEAGRARGEWRIHCHVPVFLPHLGDLGSTQDALVATLKALRTEPFSPHLEVETYTWDVLPDRLKTASKADDIARELDFVLGELGHERHRHA